MSLDNLKTNLILVIFPFKELPDTQPKSGACTNNAYVADDVYIQLPFKMQEIKRVITHFAPRIESIGIGFSDFRGETVDETDKSDHEKLETLESLWIRYVFFTCQRIKRKSLMINIQL